MEENQDKPVDTLKVIWSRKWQILLFTLVVTISAYAFSLLLPKTYQAKTTILPVPPSMGLDNKKAESLSMNSYKDLVMTSGFLQSIIDNFESENPNASVTFYPETLGKMISIESSTLAERKHQAPSALITFSVMGRDPKLITEIANILVALLTEESRKLRANEIAIISRVTQAQYMTTKNTLYELEQSLQKVKINNDLASAKANLLVKHVNLQKFEIKLMSTNVELSGNESKLSSLIAQSNKYPDMVIGDLMDTQVTSKSLAAKQGFLSNAIARLKKKIPHLEEKVIKMELKEDQLTRQVTVLEEHYLALTRRLAEARISESEKTSDIRLISKAIEPHFPVGPDRLKITLITLILGLVVGMAFALAKEHLDNIS